MSNILISGDRVFLREPLTSDVDTYVRWRTQGEWRLFDAPWEEVQGSMTEAQQAAVRKRFLDACAEEKPTPRKSAIITTHAGQPIGWLNRYAQERFPDAWMVGIDICEDSFLNGGLGTDALRLWVDYLFANSTVERIGLDTWSFNRRMIRVAEKVGFVHEGAQRHVVRWQGQWLDWVHFGKLREELARERKADSGATMIDDGRQAHRQAVRSRASVEIVRAQGSNVQEIGNLWWEFFLFHHNIDPVFPLPDDPISNFTRNHLRRFVDSEDAVGLLAMQGTRAVGYALLEMRRIPPEFKREPYGYIDQMAVTEEFRRRGVGQKLLAEIVNWCHSNGIRRLELGADARNGIANSFWRQHGFTVYSHTMCKNI